MKRICAFLDRHLVMIVATWVIVIALVVLFSPLGKGGLLDAGGMKERAAATDR